MRFILLLLAIASIAVGPVRAQDPAADADGDYVLQKAREKYDGSSDDAVEAADGEGQAESAPAVSEGSGGSNKKYKYQPYVISFVPGVSYPFGTWSTSLSVAPIGAITGSIHGAQGAGVFNIADGDIKGIQTAGVFNMAAGKVLGIQSAGVFNMAGSANVVQAAGVFNMANRVDGIQVAGVFNMADSVLGIQAAGVLNIAREIKGSMVGVINIAETLDGVAIGLVNIIGNGIHEVGVDYQFGSGMAYAAYRSGTPFLYLTVYAGQTLDDIGSTPAGASFGTGLGHRFRSRMMTVDIEMSAETPFDTEALAALGQAIEDGNPSAFTGLATWDSTFASIRATLAFGRRRGFGPYIGIKADIEPAGSARIPAVLRSSFGTAGSYPLPLCDLDLVVWPKLLLGMRF
jgi:hypothetical protein